MSKLDIPDQQLQEFKLSMGGMLHLRYADGSEEYIKIKTFRKRYDSVRMISLLTIAMCLPDKWVQL